MSWHILPDAFHVAPNSFFVGPDPVEPTESHYRTVSLAGDLAASTAPQNIRKRYTLRNYESDSESSVEDSICFLPYNMSCPTHNISGPRCALSYVNYLHGAVTRLMVPPSDASPWVPPDASRVESLMLRLDDECVELGVGGTTGWCRRAS